jgi:hemerythrin-like domain-containing protein
MRPTTILKNEHRVIEQVLTCLEKIAERFEGGQGLDVESARGAIAFFRRFADQCHHGKEEARLFPMMEERGFPRESGPIGVMLREHEEGRAHVRAMDSACDAAAAGEAAAGRDFLEHARAYVGLLRLHIQKEDHCLFPMADTALSEEDQEALAKSFEQVEKEEIGEAVHETYLGIANALAARYGVPKAAEASETSCGSAPKCDDTGR